MNILTLQVALFTKNYIDRPDMYLNKINAKMNNVFDAMPEIKNLPMDVPGDIPILSTHSSLQACRLNISRRRIDIIFDYDIQNAVSTASALDEKREFIKHYFECVTDSYEIERAGIIITTLEKRTDNIAWMLNKYFKIKGNENYTELNFHTNEISKHERFVMNNIIDVNAISIHYNDSDRPDEKGIQILRDINNVANNNTILSLTDFLFVYEHAQEKAKMEEDVE